MQEQNQSKIQLLKKYTYTESTSLLRYLCEVLLFTLLGWIIGVPGILLRGFFYRFIIKHNGFFAIESNVSIKRPYDIFLDNGVFIDNNVILRGGVGGIEIGKNTRIMCNAKLDVYNYRDLKKSKIKIGENCVIGNFSVLYGQGGLKIGNNVIMGPLVVIIPATHIYSDPNEPIINQGISTEGIEIDDDVWIGSNVTILDGVRIGRGSVIGAGAVVNKDVPPFSLAVGVPARIVKKIRRNN